MSDFDIKRLFERVGGIETSRMEGDNLAILLASQFEEGSGTLNEDTGWTYEALDGCDEVLDAIRAHFKPLAARVSQLEAALREIFEMWAGSEGFIPETAPEGYLLELIKKMADRAALAKMEESK